jgi:recombinational DNA repair protein RecT
MKKKTTIIQQFPSMTEAFEWVVSKVADATVGSIKTKYQHYGTDAILGECDSFTYVGLFNLVEIC